MKKLSKKVIAFALAVVMTLTAGAVAPQGNVEVQAASGRVYVNPYSATVVTYKPGKDVNTFTSTISIMGCDKAKEIKKLGLNLSIYTGSIFEDLLKEQNPDIMALLQQGDFLVDGPFVLAQRDLTLLFRGSQNQRILDLPQSFLQGKAVLASIGQ